MWDLLAYLFKDMTPWTCDRSWTSRSLSRFCLSGLGKFAYIGSRIDNHAAKRGRPSLAHSPGCLELSLSVLDFLYSGSLMSSRTFPDTRFLPSDLVKE